MDFSSFVYPVKDVYSYLTVAGDIIAIVVLIALLLNKKNMVTTFVQTHGLWLMFIVALAGTMGSLFFSDIAGWTPCKLCWFQRIFLYPQVIILGMAAWKNDRNMTKYILVLSMIGLVIAGLHYNEQVQAALQPLDLLEPCDETGVSCARTSISFTFGYITLPMMALTAFALNILGSIAVMRKK